MKDDVQHERELRQYLLGDLPLAEQIVVEQRLFLDTQYADLHQAVEDDLINEYLGNELIASEREKFEKHFLSLPEHGADLRIAQALKRHLAKEPVPFVVIDRNTADDPSPKPSPFSFLNKPIVWLSLSVAALIIFSILMWMVIRATRGPAAEAPLQARDPQPAQTQPDNRHQPAPPQNFNRGETAQQGNSNQASENLSQPPERRPQSAHRTVFYTLIAGGSHRSSGSSSSVTIYADTKHVQLTLPLEFTGSYETYRAELLSGERRIDRWSNLRPQRDEQYGSVVLVPVSADLLRELGYRIKVQGVPTDQQTVEPASTYSFQVERK